jgi:hypothetical protein
MLLGHALIDRLADPYKSVCAHAWLVPVRTDVLRLEPAQLRVQVDRLAAAQLAGGPSCPRVLLPLPVLGIPGWWPANEQPDFYQDARVFRASRGATAREAV